MNIFQYANIVQNHEQFLNHKHFMISGTFFLQLSFLKFGTILIPNYFIEEKKQKNGNKKTGRPAPK